MQHISDALELLTAQHAQIDDLMEFVSTLHDADALTELADVLTAHLGVEQELLYPAISAHVSSEIRDELLAEHREIKRALAELCWGGVEDPELVPKLEQLRSLVEGHAAYQEDELFTRVAETVSRERLAELGALIIKNATPVPYALAS